ncbi:pantothenate synthetase [Shouchella clausii]|nr:pantothenate synthetase [Shouchella clausii]
MIEVGTTAQLQKVLQDAREQGKTIGFVPTMGALHGGHQSLVRACTQTCDLVVVSIYVNPLQFGPHEDYHEYPRQLEKDRALAEEAGCDVLFCPTDDEMYPDGYTQTVHVKQGANVLCGKSRPGHFDGVATVVLKLFMLVQPDFAFFGEKDAQQVAIIKQLVKEFFLSVTIVACPTVREDDGLAKSSRNANLTPIERQVAPKLYAALRDAAKLPTSQLSDLVQQVRQHLAALPLGSIDYVEAYEYPSLKKVEQSDGVVILALAYQFSKARLIDHILIDMNNRDGGLNDVSDNDESKIASCTGY